MGPVGLCYGHSSSSLVRILQNVRVVVAQSLGRASHPVIFDRWLNLESGHFRNKPEHKPQPTISTFWEYSHDEAMSCTNHEGVSMSLNIDVLAARIPVFGIILVCAEYGPVSLSYLLCTLATLEMDSGN